MASCFLIDSDYKFPQNAEQKNLIDNIRRVFMKIHQTSLPFFLSRISNITKENYQEKLKDANVVVINSFPPDIIFSDSDEYVKLGLEKDAFLLNLNTLVVPEDEAETQANAVTFFPQQFKSAYERSKNWNVVGELGFIPPSAYVLPGTNKQTVFHMGASRQKNGKWEFLSLRMEEFMKYSFENVLGISSDLVPEKTKKFLDFMKTEMKNKPGLTLKEIKGIIKMGFKNTFRLDPDVFFMPYYVNHFALDRKEGLEYLQKTANMCSVVTLKRGASFEEKSLRCAKEAATIP